MAWSSLNSIHVTNAGVAVYPPGATFGPRKMRDFEFVWIIEGEALTSYDEKQIPSPAGSVLLCRPGMTDRYEWSAKRTSMHAFFHFELPSIPTDWPPMSDWPMVRRTTPEEVLRPLFRYVLRLHPQQEPMRSALLAPCVELMLKSFVSGILAISAEPYAKLPAAVERALKLIRGVALQEPSPQITLAQLARAAHVTPEHLCRLFRQSLDLCPVKCVRLARLERAATLLARSNLAIKEIAHSIGFASPYHFSRKFREVYGVAPREYRQSIREGEEVRQNPISTALLVNIFSRVS